MKRTLVACGIVALGAALMPVVQAQEPLRTALVAQGGGGGRGGGVFSLQQVPIETTPIKGAPYFAEVVTESVQVLADGNRIVRRTTGRVYRDSQGRIRRETDREPGLVRSISITDPIAGESWSLNPEEKVAWKTGYQTAGAIAMIAKKVQEISPDPQEIERRRQVEFETQRAAEQAGGGGGGRGRSAGSGSGTGAGGGTGGFGGRIGGGVPGVVTMPGGWAEKSEKLPARQIEGVMAEGTRTTRTIPAGAIGNEQPIAIVTEQWRSPDLQVLVLTRTSDPRTGDSTYRLTGITRGEPNASWFQVPADYTVRETGIRREARRQ